MAHDLVVGALGVGHIHRAFIDGVEVLVHRHNALLDRLRIRQETCEVPAAALDDRSQMLESRTAGCDSVRNAWGAVACTEEDSVLGSAETDQRVPAEHQAIREHLAQDVRNADQFGGVHVFGIPAFVDKMQCSNLSLRWEKR